MEYCTQAKDSVTRYWNWSVILRMQGIQRRVTKIRVKYLRNQNKLFYKKEEWEVILLKPTN